MNELWLAYGTEAGLSGFHLVIQLRKTVEAFTAMIAE